MIVSHGWTWQVGGGQHDLRVRPWRHVTDRAACEPKATVELKNFAIDKYHVYH